jgi:hypothetical protein
MIDFLINIEPFDNNILQTKGNDIDIDRYCMD